MPTSPVLKWLEDLDRIEPPQSHHGIGKMPRIETLWAFLSVDKQGNEGLCGHVIPGLGWIGMMAADERRVDALREIAREIARESGKKIRLAKFTLREDLSVIDGTDA